MRMIGRKMITSTSVVGKKKNYPQIIKRGKNNLKPSLSALRPTHSYKWSAWTEYRETLERGSLAYSERVDKNEIYLAED